MKKLLLAILIGGALMANTAKARTLVAYFTLTGNTEKAAKIIAEETNADLYQIELVTPYPSEYKEQTELAKKELSEGILPAIKPWPENIGEYDVVFVGSPVWWGTMATPVRTFLASGVLKGKTVIPFVTHGGGGADNSFAEVSQWVWADGQRKAWKKQQNKAVNPTAQNNNAGLFYGRSVFAFNSSGNSGALSFLDGVGGGCIFLRLGLSFRGSSGLDRLDCKKM